LEKSFFSFLDGFSGYNQIQIVHEDQDKTTFRCPWGTFTYWVLPFGLCNAPAMFQREIFGIFSDLVDDSVEIYMDDFTPYGDSFLEGLKNLEKSSRKVYTSACLSEYSKIPYDDGGESHELHSTILLVILIFFFLQVYPVI